MVRMILSNVYDQEQKIFVFNKYLRLRDTIPTTLINRFVQSHHPKITIQKFICRMPFIPIKSHHQTLHTIKPNLTWKKHQKRIHGRWIMQYNHTNITVTKVVDQKYPLSQEFSGSPASSWMTKTQNLKTT